ncbi:methyltransferase domain-containing protein [Rubrivirga sp.]|uniref:methyltransferase domain-containing protein n=1 Tax=Rubrivirga sp. TaxID=1885344 RepID=UPI003B52487E
MCRRSVDVVISNCVLNLAPDKAVVFEEITRVLKPGGDLYVSDVFADRRLPGAVRRDPVLVGECLGGALYTEGFRWLMAGLGWADVRTVAAPATAAFSMWPATARRTSACSTASRRRPPRTAGWAEAAASPTRRRR